LFYNLNSAFTSEKGGPMPSQEDRPDFSDKFFNLPNFSGRTWVYRGTYFYFLKNGLSGSEWQGDSEINRRLLKRKQILKNLRQKIPRDPDLQKEKESELKRVSQAEKKYANHPNFYMLSHDYEDIDGLFSGREYIIFGQAILRYLTHQAVRRDPNQGAWHERAVCDIFFKEASGEWYKLKDEDPLEWYEIEEERGIDSEREITVIIQPLGIKRLTLFGSQSSEEEPPNFRQWTRQENKFDHFSFKDKKHYLTYLDDLNEYECYAMSTYYKRSSDGQAGYEIQILNQGVAIICWQNGKKVAVRRANDEIYVLKENEKIVFEFPKDKKEDEKIKWIRLGIREGEKEPIFFRKILRPS